MSDAKGFADGNPFCNTGRPACVRDCNGTWCGDIKKEAQVALPAEEEQQAVNLLSVPTKSEFVPNRCVWGGAHTGSCLSDAVGITEDKYCNEDRANCVGNCHGTWCGDVQDPESVPAVTAPGEFVENRCVWGGAHSGACMSGAKGFPEGNPFCNTGRPACVRDCQGTWCGDIKKEAQVALATVEEQQAVNLSSSMPLDDQSFISKVAAGLAISGAVVGLVGIVKKVQYKKKESLLDNEVIA